MRDICPDFSTDRTELAFCSDRTGTFEIWTIKPDGGQPEQLTAVGGQMLWPDFAPDRNSIVFSGQTDPNADENASEIWTINRDGSGLTQLTDSPGVDQYPNFSPDGSRLVFVSARSGTQQLWTMGADGSTPQQLTFDDTVAIDQAPEWSPDGARIAYAASGDIFVIDVSGGDPQRLTTDAADEFGPTWSPDGAEIAFISGTEPTRQLVAVTLDGPSQRTITSDGTPGVPDWS